MKLFITGIIIYILGQSLVFGCLLNGKIFMAVVAAACCLIMFIVAAYFANLMCTPF